MGVINIQALAYNGARTESTKTFLKHVDIFNKNLANSWLSKLNLHNLIDTIVDTTKQKSCNAKNKIGSRK